MKPSAFPSTASTLSAASLSAAELYRRLDEMPISAHDREQAKATLRTAERIADWLAAIVAGLKSSTARIGFPSTRRSTLRNSPAPR